MVSASKSVAGAADAVPQPGDGRVTPDIADAWRAILLRQPHWRAEAELRAEYEASAVERHPILLEYAEELARHGYRVVGMPDLRIDPKMDVFQRVNLDFGFCNVLAGLHGKRPAVYHFQSGVRSLDEDAARRIQLAGVKPVPVSNPEVASALMLLQGGLHCCCGSL